MTGLQKPTPKSQKTDSDDREFKVTDMRKFSEVQENRERESNELGHQINEQKEYFTEETETLKRTRYSGAEEFNKGEEEHIREHRKESRPRRWRRN